MAVDRVLVENTDLWDCLHDGKFMSVVLDGPRLTLDISIPYVRERFRDPYVSERDGIPGRSLLIDLMGFVRGEYLSDDHEGPQPLENLVSHHRYLLYVEPIHGGVKLSLVGSSLSLWYEWAALRLAPDRPVAMAAILKACNDYWTEFSQGVHSIEDPVEHDPSHYGNCGCCDSEATETKPEL